MEIFREITPIRAVLFYEQIHKMRIKVSYEF
jgi:hypothetical protein